MGKNEIPQSAEDDGRALLLEISRIYVDVVVETHITRIFAF